MGKWTAGIVGGVLTGVVLWLLTNALFTRWFSSPPPSPAPSPPDEVRIQCVANPARVAPGGITEVAVTVTRRGEPVEGAAVELRAGVGSSDSGLSISSGQTYSGGVFRTTWRAPSPSAAAYVFPAEVDLGGLRTLDGELQGHYRTNCEILVGQ